MNEKNASHCMHAKLIVMFHEFLMNAMRVHELTIQYRSDEEYFWDVRREPVGALV